VVDSRLYHRPLDPQRAPLGHPPVPGQVHHAVIQRLEGGSPDGVRPAEQRGGIGDPLKVEAAEPAQHQAIGHAPLRLALALVVEMLDEQQAQQHLDRPRVATTAEGLGIARAEISADLGVEEIIVEQAIQVREHGVGLLGQRGDAGKDIFTGVAIDQHGGAPSHTRHRSACFTSLGYFTPPLAPPHPHFAAATDTRNCLKRVLSP